MSTETNKAIVRRLVEEGINQANSVYEISVHVEVIEQGSAHVRGI